MRGKVAEKAGRVREAVALYEKAIALGLTDPQLARRVDRLRHPEGSQP